LISKAPAGYFISWKEASSRIADEQQDFDKIVETPSPDRIYQQALPLFHLPEYTK
jgi:hypothetical protein